jgi:GTP 3',8-cyclase
VIRALSDNVDTAASLIDGCGRVIDHLRLAVTPACDFRCVYCQPAGNPPDSGSGRRMTDDQRVDLVRFLHTHCGLSQVRITGGEPLLYRDVVSLVADIRRSAPGITLAMTTNGRLLYERGFELRRAGLDRLNVSLDSLDPTVYRKITGGNVADVLRGIESAIHVGFSPPKINTVALRGVNDDQIVTLVQWAMSLGCEIRFLEVMPIGPAAKTNRRLFLSAEDIRTRLGEAFTLDPIEIRPGETAKRYRATGSTCSGVVGIIAPVTEPFCSDCRRMRVTAEGMLYPCLLDSRSIDLADVWRDGRFDAARAGDLIRSTITRKPAAGTTQTDPMVTIGG